MTAKLLFFDYFCKSIRACLIRNVKKTMSRKVYYKYDSTTDSYEKVSLSRWDKVWNIAKTVFEFSGVALLICLCLYYWIDLPKEKMLREENERLREEIDRIDSELPPLRLFVLPGGSRAAAVCHVCRTVCRRAERRILSLAETVEIAPELLSYMNRLSDYFFVFSRKVNQNEKKEEIFWNNSGI